MTVWVDFETKSNCDLPKKGAYNYAQDGSTDVLCMAYAFDDEDVQLWLPGQPLPDFTGHMIYAHSAAFERLIFWYVLQQDYPLEQFYCTAAQARANCLPGSLEDVGRALSSKMRKDHRGSELVRKCCCPPFNTELLPELYEYCLQDVRTMREISKAMRPLSEQELADYHTNERINDRGVLVDVDLCKAAIKYSDAELEEVQQIFREITGLTSVRSPKMRQWVQERVGPEALKLMTVYKDGEKKMSVDKNVRAALLILAEENPDEVPCEVADVLQCADDVWASSVAKFSRLQALADEEDHRVRGAFVFAGGSATGRASSYGAQVHNFTRKCAKLPEDVRHAMVRGHQIVPAYGKRITDVLKGMLRPALIPAKGNVFVVADWSAIEGRVTPWLAHNAWSEDKLNVFRSGEDPYKVNAAATFSTTYDAVTSDQRQIGKVQELSCFAAETKVLTSNGIKAIVDVSCDDLLWDGVSWVKHQGVINRGLRKTIDVCGVQVTEDHLLKVRSGWKDAKTVRSSERYLTQALEVGSENLPYWEQTWSSKERVTSAWYWCNASVGQSLTMSAFTTCSREQVLDVTSALRKHRGIGGKTISSMLMPVQMMLTDVGCLTGYLHAKTVVTTQRTAATQTTAGEVLDFTSRGEQTKRRFSAMLCRLMDGISLLWNWTGSTLTATTRRAIFGSYRSARTAITSEKCKNYSNEYYTLRNVYDIVLAGPRNRFTIATNRGLMIAHNCGFSGGVGAFASMGRAYGVLISETEAQRMVHGWRRANPWAMPYWQELESTYRRAMRNKGKEFSVGRTTYLYDGQHLWYMLPSGRVLCYPFAKFEGDEITYLKAAWKPAADAKEWPRARLWRGLSCENITQATANDLLRESCRHFDNIVLTVHDEIVLECAEQDAEGYVSKLQNVMCTPPEWAKGLPLAIEVKIMRRYGK